MPLLSNKPTRRHLCRIKAVRENDKLEFNEQFINGVIASQSADWRGNPLRKGEKPNENQVQTFGDCHNHCARRRMQSATAKGGS